MRVAFFGAADGDRRGVSAVGFARRSPPAYDFDWQLHHGGEISSPAS